MPTMREGSFTQEDLMHISDAFHFALNAHQTHERSTTEPYIVHPLRVAIHAADIGLGVESIMAALLHDVVEDSDIPIDEIEERFGSTIAKIVEALTKPEAGTPDRFKLYREKLLKGPDEAKIIKLLDIQDNLSDVDDFLPPARASAYRESRMQLARDLVKELGDQGEKLASNIL